MKNAILVAVGCTLLTIISCKKDKDDDKPVTAVDLITSATWKIDTMGLDTNGDGTIDAAIPGGALTPCQLDNTLTFSSDSTGIFSEGATKCDDGDPDTTPLEWYLKENDKIIYLSGLQSQLNGNVNILTLTSESFIVSKANTPPIPGALIVALKK